MILCGRPVVLTTLLLALASFSCSVLAAPLLTDRIIESDRVTLAGNTRPEATRLNDQGAVADDLPMEHMVLQLTRPADRELALQRRIDGLTDPSSPYYHQFLTASELGQTYGPAADDVQKISAWLTSYGFTVNGIATSLMAIDFSGSALSVRQAFHTEIHSLTVKGVSHLANMSDPTIPAALAPVVSGIVSLHDFTPRAKNRPRAAYTVASNQGAQQELVPGDLATIYDLTRLFAAGISGQGETIAVIEDSDLYNNGDWTTFRSVFGLSAYHGGLLSVVHPGATSGTSCTDPGVATSGDDQEATLDAEWASAAAPSATILVAACATTRATFGGFLALQNLLNSASPPPIVSLSYGTCEAENGATANRAVSTLFQQAAALGISVFVSAGDSGAAGCDAGNDGATHGIGVSAYASTAYNVAVGGTDFGDTVAGTVSKYWSSSNSTTYASAISYIPEIPWDDSCASQLIASYAGYAVSYGTSGYCSSRAASNAQLVTTTAGSGGPSGCASGTPSRQGIVGGSCAGLAKPSWQSGTGVMADGVRDIPDIAMFAADGVWGHFYVICYSNTANQGAACNGPPSQWSGGGGTSFAAPIMAGIQALVNQHSGSRQGNPNPVYYKLAAQPGKTCIATGNITSGCIFHNVTTGSIDVDCSGSVDCYGATAMRNEFSFGFGFGFGFGGGSGGSNSYNGVLSLSAQTDQIAYSAGSGWNFATGLGSVDAYNLVMGW